MPRLVGCACVADKDDLGIRFAFSVVFRQRNKFRVVAWDAREMALTPIVLGFGNALLRARHEVPPNVTWPFHGLSAEQHQPRVRFSKDRNAIAGLENEKLASIKRLPRNIDAARCDKDGALVVVGIERQNSAGPPRFGIKAIVREGGRRRLAEKRSNDQPN